MRLRVLLVALVALTFAAPSVASANDAPPQSWNVRPHRPYATTTEQPANLPGYDVFRPADLRSFRYPRPVIAWANGGCVRYNGIWRPLLQQWAAAGFVVVAVGTPPGGDPGSVFGVDDQARAIDWAVSENQRPSSPYRGRLDLHRIVAAGNSCGGITTLNLAARDPRIRSVFVLSGSSVLPGGSQSEAHRIMSAIRAPVGYAIGGPQDISTAFAQRDYDIAASLGHPVMLAHRATGDHFAVSTDARVLAEVAQISIKWLDFTLYGSQLARVGLLHRPCDTCSSGTWSVQSANLFNRGHR